MDPAPAAPALVRWSVGGSAHARWCWAGTPVRASASVAPSRGLSSQTSRSRRPRRSRDPAAAHRLDAVTHETHRLRRSRSRRAADQPQAPPGRADRRATNEPRLRCASLRRCGGGPAPVPLGIAAAALRRAQLPVTAAPIQTWKITPRPARAARRAAADVADPAARDGPRRPDVPPAPRTQVRLQRPVTPLRWTTPGHAGGQGGPGSSGTSGTGPPGPAGSGSRATTRRRCGLTSPDAGAAGVLGAHAGTSPRP